MPLLSCYGQTVCQGLDCCLHGPARVPGRREPGRYAPPWGAGSSSSVGEVSIPTRSREWHCHCDARSYAPGDALRGLALRPRTGGRGPGRWENASLGEMIQRLGKAGVSVPDGFATTAQAYRDFLAAHDLAGPIRAWLERYERRKVPLARAGAAIRRLFLERDLPPAIAEAIRAAYRELGRRVGRGDPDVAVRSSATAEDLPEASFAGQQETFLNVRGEQALLDAVIVRQRASPACRRRSPPGARGRPRWL